MTFDEWFKLNRDMLKSAYDAGFQEGKKTVAAVNKPIPTVPYVTPDPFKRTHEATWPNIKSCSKCGINLSGVMGYVCYDLQCPTQMKITCGSGSTLGGGIMGSAGSAGAKGGYGYSEGVGMGEIKK